MILSIVTGTYNRLKYLKDFMRSCRDSLPSNWRPGIEYEYCICDGGSTDGTVGWLENQPGIKLVKHPELLGGIRAFQDASVQADGDYLFIAGDDLEVVGKTLTAG